MLQRHLRIFQQSCLLFVLSILLLGSVGSSLAVPVRPNILWITAEDLSPHLGCYGETQARTPHLDRLAEQGVCYTIIGTLEKI